MARSSSNSKIVLPSVILILRLLALLLLAVSLAVIATDKLKIDDPPQKFTFKDVYAYRYLLAIAVIGCAYTLVQIPFAVISIAKRKRMIGGTENVALFLICADVIFALLIATGAAAAYGYTYDVKRYADFFYGGFDQVPEVSKLLRDIHMAFNLAIVSAGVMLLAAKCMVFIIMISVYSLVK